MKNKKKIPLKFIPRSKEVNVPRYRYRLLAQKEIPGLAVAISRIWISGSQSTTCHIEAARECTLGHVRMHKYAHKRRVHETESDAH